MIKQMLFVKLILAALGIQGSYCLQQPLPLSVAGTWGEKKRAEYTERRLCWQLLLLEFNSLFVLGRAINLGGGGVGGEGGEELQLFATSQAPDFLILISS